MKIISKITIVSVLLLVQIFPQSNIPDQITIGELETHVKFLASEEFAGRKPGTDGGKLTAEYIRKELLDNGLSPLFDNAFQSFDVVTSLSYGKENSFELEGFEGTLEKNFVPLGISVSKKLNAEAVFVGYGFQIDETKMKWDDYKDIDVTGKWAVVIRAAPELDDFNFEDYSSLRKKILTAKDNGAAGVLFVSGLSEDPDDDLMKIDYTKGHFTEIPALHISRDIAEKLFETADVSIEELEDHFATEKMPYGFDTEIIVSASADIVENRVPTQNVVTLIEGSDPVLKNEYLVLGAHHDHLGYGGPGSGSRQPDTSAVHYGADDNASGVASVIEIAEKLASDVNQLKRSIIVMTFDGEEMGLLGSKYFVNNPSVDLDKIKGMLNIDMLGRINEEEKDFNIGGVGTAAEFAEIIKKYSENSSLKVETSTAGYGPSDHASFYSNDVPVLFVFSGLHDDYHTPRDTPDKLNYADQKIACDIVYNLIVDLANRDEALVFQEAGPKTPEAKGRPKFKVTLGIMPDVASSDNDGLRIDAVMNGRPAKKAGIMKGDKLIEMDGKPVNNIYDYMSRLSSFKKGQKIKVIVIRDDEKVEIDVEL